MVTPTEYGQVFDLGDIVVKFISGEDQPESDCIDCDICALRKVNCVDIECYPTETMKLDGLYVEVGREDV